MSQHCIARNGNLPVRHKSPIRILRKPKPSTINDATRFDRCPRKAAPNSNRTKSHSNPSQTALPSGTTKSPGRRWCLLLSTCSTPSTQYHRKRSATTLGTHRRRLPDGQRRVEASRRCARASGRVPSIAHQSDSWVLGQPGLSAELCEHVQRLRKVFVGASPKVARTEQRNDEINK